jgi:hypothetical protein
MIKFRNTQPEAESKGALMQTSFAVRPAELKSIAIFADAKIKRKNKTPWQSITSQLRQSAEAKDAVRPPPPRIVPLMK